MQECRKRPMHPMGKRHCRHDRPCPLIHCVVSSSKTRSYFHLVPVIQQVCTGCSTRVNTVDGDRHVVQRKKSRRDIGYFPESTGELRHNDERQASIPLRLRGSGRFRGGRNRRWTSTRYEPPLPHRCSHPSWAPAMSVRVSKLVG